MVDPKELSVIVLNTRLTLQLFIGLKDRRMLVLTLVMLLSLLATQAEGRGNLALCAAHANGCSIPYDLPFFYKTTFTPSCNQHDNCYACGSHCGISKATCDQWFLDAMLAACAQNGKRDLDLDRDKRSAACRAAANTYYEAVNQYGDSHYLQNGANPSFCVSDPSRVKGCLGI